LHHGKRVLSLMFLARALATVGHPLPVAAPMNLKSPDLQRMLRAAPWTAGLTPDQLRAVEAELTERHFDAGEQVAHQGDAGQDWLGVIDGMVKVEAVALDGRSTTFNCICAGGWFGEGMVIGGQPLRYDVVALLRSHVCFLPRAAFLRLLEASPHFNRFIISMLSARLSQFMLLTETTRMHDSVAQVACGVAQLFDPQLNARPRWDVCITLEEIGRLCGCSRQAASRALHRLEQAGLVHVHHRGVEVLDVSGLRAWRN
jgi:CRP/FNR family transcriptional regulator, cyclic AMP receptor protein